MRQNGIRDPRTTLRTARKVNREKGQMPLARACALLEKESAGGGNVFGHDPSIFNGAGEVTRAKYLAYKAKRGPTGGGGMQGVGPCQLTWFTLQDRADALGGCWRPNVNMYVGFSHLAANIEANGAHAGMRIYNGSGQAAEDYATDLEKKEARWRERLERALSTKRPAAPGPQKPSRPPAGRPGRPAAGGQPARPEPAAPSRPGPAPARPEPAAPAPRAAISRGDRGRAVVRLTTRLSFVSSRKSGAPYLDGKREVFDRETEQALQLFQAQHGLDVDGIYGMRSARTLTRAVVAQKQRRADESGGHDERKGAALLAHLDLLDARGDRARAALRERGQELEQQLRRERRLGARAKQQLEGARPAIGDRELAIVTEQLSRLFAGLVSEVRSTVEQELRDERRERMSVDAELAALISGARAKVSQRAQPAAPADGGGGGTAVTAPRWPSNAGAGRPAGPAGTAPSAGPASSTALKPSGGPPDPPDLLDEPREGGAGGGAESVDPVPPAGPPQKGRGVAPGAPAGSDATVEELIERLMRLNVEEDRVRAQLEERYELLETKVASARRRRLRAQAELRRARGEAPRRGGAAEPLPDQSKPAPGGRPPRPDRPQQTGAKPTPRPPRAPQGRPGAKPGQGSPPGTVVAEWRLKARPHRQLDFGERGADVSKLQRALNKRLRYLGSRTRIAEDGVYGPSTHRAFGQVAYGLGLAHRKPTKRHQLLVRAPWRRRAEQRRRATARRPKRPPEGQLSPHFHVSEFDCNDGTPVPSYMHDHLREWCRRFGEPLRARYGAAVVNSGYRHRSYNAGVGGEDGSFHIYDDRRSQPAADVRFGRGSPAAWGATAKQLRGGAGGVGIYGSFVHCDTRTYASDWWG